MEGVGWERTIEDVRTNARALQKWEHEHCAIYAGGDVLMLDELCQKLAKALYEVQRMTTDQEAREVLAVAIFAYEDAYGL